MTELGKRLREARLEKGMSIEDLQEITKIQKRYLLGIEEGNYSMMPGPFYVRAFIKQYAEAVGLNPEEIFEQYKSDIPSTNREDLPEQLSRVQSRKSVPVSNSKFLDMLPRILIIAFVLGALVLLWYLLPNFTSKDTGPAQEKSDEEIHFDKSDELTNEPEEEEPANEDEPGKESEPGEEEETEGGVEGDEEEAGEENGGQGQKPEIAVVEAKGKITIYEVKNIEEVELKIVSKGETWVKVLNSKNEPLFDGGMLVAGSENESLTFDVTNESEVFIVAGRTQDTEIYINGHLLEYAVSPSDQVRQDITIRFVKDSE